MTQSETIQKLAELCRLIASLTGQLQQAEAARDTLIQRLADSDGAHDRRPMAVR